MTKNIQRTDVVHNSRYEISTFKHRDAWVRQLLAVNGETLIPGAKIVGVSIALHLNVNTRRCNPQLQTLADSTGTSERNVRRLLRLLEQAGWLVVDQSSGGRRAGDDYNSNSHELHVPETRTDESALNPDTDDRVEEAKPDTESTLTRTSKVANPDNNVRPYKQANLQAKKQAKERVPRLDLGDEDSGRRDGHPPDTTEADFDEFYRTYPKREARPKALNAYLGALKKGITPAVLLAGAMRAVAAYQRDVERRGQETAYQFLAHPASWLNAERWADEPAKPAGITLDGDGNLVRQPPAQHQQRSWMDIAMGDLPDGVLS